MPDYVLNPKMEMPVKVIDGQEYIAVLKIPAFGLELPVLSQWSYPNLKSPPAGIRDPPTRTIWSLRLTTTPPILVT